MGIKEIWENLTRDTAVTYPYFRIENVAGSDTGNLERFVEWDSYFEIRVSQMHIVDSRVYWRNFLPLASILLEFQFDGEKRSIPVVIGPERLKNVEKVEEGNAVDFRNVRAAGPFPYEGSDVALFTGLFRMVTKDWAKQALSLLETVAEAFDTTKLTRYINIADPLVTGLESFLGMDDVELRLGRLDEREAPVADDKASNESAESNDSETAFRPGFYVLVRDPQLKEQEWTKFSVDGERLMYSENGSVREYKDNDFILIRIRALDRRSDYATFDFHRREWKKVREHLAERNEDAALKAWSLLIASLAQCDDITWSQRQALLKFYKEQFQQLRASLEEAADPRRAVDETAAIEEKDLQDAAATPSKGRMAESVEELLSVATL